MPNTKSAKKRVSVLERRRRENRYIKSTMSTKIKNFIKVLKDDVSKAEIMLRDVISYIDSAQTKKVIHKKNASRKISRLSIMLSKAKKCELVNEEKPEMPVEENEKVVKETEIKPKKLLEEKIEKSAKKTSEKTVKKTVEKTVEKKPKKIIEEKATKKAASKK